MAKRKNLSKEDHEDVSIYEEESQRRNTYEPNKVRLNDLSIKVKCANPKQKDLKKAIEEKDVVVSIGAAGTGKTYISLITALHLMKTQPKYKKLVLVKSLQTIKGEELGFLPGNIMEKMEPYMHSFVGNLDKIFHNTTVTKELIDKGVIEIQPIAYIRGVTKDNCIVIVDEAQNLSMHTFRTIITRIGKSCKMIFLGDTEQVDLKVKEVSCLSKVATLFKDKEFSDSIEFNDEDSVRNPIIPKLLELLKDEE